MPLSPQKANLIFFLFCISVVLLILVWNFFINKGTLVFVSDPPFEVKIQGASDLKCEKEQCKARLTPRTYTATFSKEGYFDKTVQVPVKRWQTELYEIDFLLIPVIEKRGEIGKIILPEQKKTYTHNLKKISFSALLDQEGKTFKEYPEDITNILFSNNAEKALIFTETNKVFVYNFEKNKIDEINFKENNLDLIWGQDTETLIVLTSKIGAKDQVLHQMSINDGKETNITYFPREVKEAKLYLSLDGEKIILVDQTKEVRKIYFIDIAQKNKKYISEIDQEVLGIKWADSNKHVAIITENLQTEETGIWLFDIEKEFLKKLDFMAPEHAITWLNDRIVFLANKGDIEKNLAQSRNENLWTSVLGESVVKIKRNPEVERVFVEYDTNQHIMHHLIDLPKELFGFDVRLETKKDKTGVYFLAGEEVYEVVLE